MADKLLEQMADEFCRWKLPETFNPDGGILFNRTYSGFVEHRFVQIDRKPSDPNWPIGTNLFTRAEALAMFTEIVGPKIAELETPTQRYAKADINDEEEFERLHRENNAYVGSLEYRGNTVSYLADKGRNYGDQLLKAHQLSGAVSGQSVHDRITELVADNAALRLDNKRLQQQHEMDYAVMAGDTALIAGLRSDIAALQAENARLRKAFEVPCAWEIHRCTGLSEGQRELVFSPLTDDIYMDEGDEAIPLFTKPEGGEG